MHRGGQKRHSPGPIGRDIQDRGYELPRTPLPRTLVNKGERMSCWENILAAMKAGRDEGSVLIMGITQSVGKREVECE
jgi:hypothetical protein